MRIVDDRVGMDTGIYVVCSDREILSRINSMLRRSGIIGITDAEGKYHYFVDARTRHGKAAARISEIVTDNTARLQREDTDILINETLRSILVFYDFDLTLMGTCAIIEIVRKMVKSTNIYYHGFKELLTIAGNTLMLSYNQVERDIRYSVKKSSFNGMGMKTTVILRLLADEVCERISKEKRQSV